MSQNDDLWPLTETMWTAYVEGADERLADLPVRVAAEYSVRGEVRARQYVFSKDALPAVCERLGFDPQQARQLALILRVWGRCYTYNERRQWSNDQSPKTGTTT